MIATPSRAVRAAEVQQDCPRHGGVQNKIGLSPLFYLSVCNQPVALLPKNNPLFSLSHLAPNPWGATHSHTGTPAPVLALAALLAVGGRGTPVGPDGNTCAFAPGRHHPLQRASGHLCRPPATRPAGDVAGMSLLGSYRIVCTRTFSRRPGWPALPAAAAAAADDATDAAADAATDAAADAAADAELLPLAICV